MNTHANKNLKSRPGTGLIPILTLTAIVIAPVAQMRAQNGAGPSLQQFSLTGFQSNSSAPFVLQGDLVGNGAIWKHVINPVLGTTVGVVSSPPGGAVFQVEYSQDQIVAQDGSTITVNLYGIRSTPTGSTGAHITNGAYDIVSGTGRYQGIRGTGTVTINVHDDGTAFILIGGSHCSGGMCIFFQ